MYGTRRFPISSVKHLRIEHEIVRFSLLTGQLLGELVVVKVLLPSQPMFLQPTPAVVVPYQPPLSMYTGPLSSTPAPHVNLQPHLSSNARDTNASPPSRRPFSQTSNFNHHKPTHHTLSQLQHHHQVSLTNYHVN